MTSVAESLTTTSVGTRARQSPFMRLGGLFASKASQLSDFTIELKEPHRKYGPGDTVHGKVILGALRPIGVTHIVISLHGFVQVFKNHNRPKPVRHSAASRAASGKRWVTEYYGDGYASLFEEEIVLCGEGRLKPNVYHFEFEVQFPRHLELPSDIEFERGSICYMVTATITRTAGLTTTVTTECPVRYRDRIDVGELPKPKPRVVTLEPIERNGKARANLKRLTSYSGDKKRNSPVSLTSRDARSTRTLNSVSTIQYEEAGSERPASPSIASTISASSGGGGAGAGAGAGAGTGGTGVAAGLPSLQQPSDARSSIVSSGPRVQIEAPARKTITASVQVDRLGSLPGDVVPVRISISHVKPIRSVNGIVVTLYRQARVDQHPNLPIGPTDDGKGSRYEDYYPRSRTGLGGLSLSAAGSSQVWRKDLSQTFAPLIVDPRSLTAQVKVGIRVPEDAFPTIKNAPGEMISFTYAVEVVIDIQGKLATAGSILPNLSLVEGSKSLGNTNAMGSQYPGETLTAVGVNCMDTTQLRREKNAITCICDLIVGTVDSGKDRGRKSSKTSQTNSQQTHSGSDEQSFETSSANPAHDAENSVHDSTGQAHWNEYNDYYNDGYYGYGYDGYGYGYDEAHAYDYGRGNGAAHYPDHGQTSTNGHGLVPPPHALPDENVSEKELLRQAEARVMPSAPPEDDGPSFPVPGMSQPPSAPYLANGGYHDTVLVSATPHNHNAGVSQNIHSARQRHYSESAAAPTYAPAESSRGTGNSARNSSAHDASSSQHAPEASSHSTPTPDQGSVMPGAGEGPSVPPVSEEDEIQAFGPPTSMRDEQPIDFREQLPQYER